MAPWGQFTVASLLSPFHNDDICTMAANWCASISRALPTMLARYAVCCTICDSIDTKPDLVSSTALQNLISLDKLLAGSHQLQHFAYAYPERNRVFGSAAHNDTINWIARTLDETGYYNVELQPFTELYFGGNVSLTLNDLVEPAGIFSYTPRGSVEGSVVAVANLGCEVDDFPEDVHGSVALILRGSCSFADKASNALAAGADAAIIYDSVKSDIPLTGTLGGVGDFVPVVGITLEAGRTLLELLTVSEVIANVTVNTVLRNQTTYNVIAETKEGDHDNVLALGAHSDSVEAGPGINDDGSGTVGIFEVAKALANFRVRNAVRFCFWSAEEYGLLGSSYYVSQLNKSAENIAKLRAYLNFDMIASPNFKLGVYDGDGSAFNISGPLGSAQLQAGLNQFFKNKGYHSVPSAFDGRSDYGPFLDVGVASGGVDTGAEGIKTEKEAALFGGQAGIAYDVNYHQAGDTILNLNLEAYLLNTHAIADAVATYAMSLDAIPIRDSATPYGQSKAEYSHGRLNCEGSIHGQPRRAVVPTY